MAQLIIKERGENVIIYEDGRIMIKNVILSYPHLGKKWSKTDPKTGNTPEPRYSMVALLEKETHQEAYDLITGHIRQLLKETNDLKVGKKDWFIRDGDDTAKPENQDRWTVNAGEQRNVIIRDKSANVMRDVKGELYVDDVTEIENMFYPGSIVDVMIRPWIQQSKEWGNKVNAGLVTVKMVDDTTERLGGGALDDDGAWGDEDDKPARRASTSKPSRKTALDDDDDEM